MSDLIQSFADSTEQQLSGMENTVTEIQRKIRSLSISETTKL